jgi:hypothetical protein
MSEEENVVVEETLAGDTCPMPEETVETPVEETE